MDDDDMDEDRCTTGQPTDTTLQDRIDEQTARAWTALADVLDDWQPEGSPAAGIGWPRPPSVRAPPPPPKAVR